MAYKCGEPALRDNYCAPVFYSGSPYQVPDPIASLYVPCIYTEEWLYERGPGELLAVVRIRGGKVQSITYGRQPHWRPSVPNTRRYQEADWRAVWPLLHSTFSSGDTYAYSPESTEAEVHSAWIEAPVATYVACAPDGRLLGTYTLKANQPGLGCARVQLRLRRRAGGAGPGHCFGVVRALAGGRRLAMGFRVHAVQSRRVSTNERAVRLWQKLGFSVVGRLPGAFRHQRLGFVDALVMYKELARAT